LPQILLGTAPDRRGVLAIGGRSLDLSTQTPWRAMKAGLALVPADRKRDGGVLSLRVGDNLVLPVLARYQQGPIQHRRRMKADAARRLEQFRVQPRDPNTDYANLSGGNQQKVLLAKWLQTKP
jgi:ribose transport system ATP-binding protein